MDAVTGYRWYASTQITRARRVGLLRRLEMPLAQIAGVVDQPPLQAVASVRSRAAADARAAGERAELARYVCLFGEAEALCHSSAALVAAVDVQRDPP